MTKQLPLLLPPPQQQQLLLLQFSYKLAQHMKVSTLINSIVRVLLYDVDVDNLPSYYYYLGSRLVYFRPD